jgi:adenylate kinase family enzyme
MKRVIVEGPGAAGKSTLAARLGEITRLPVIELDTLFWRPGLAPTPREEWAAIQRQLAAQESWIMDGDLASGVPDTAAAIGAVSWPDV